MFATRTIKVYVLRFWSTGVRECMGAWAISCCVASRLPSTSTSCAPPSGQRCGQCYAHTCHAGSEPMARYACTSGVATMARSRARCSDQQGNSMQQLCSARRAKMQSNACYAGNRQRMSSWRSRSGLRTGVSVCRNHMSNISCAAIIGAQRMTA
jgi:hypothetical protein